MISSFTVQLLGVSPVATHVPHCVRCSTGVDGVLRLIRPPLTLKLLRQPSHYNLEVSRQFGESYRELKAKPSASAWLSRPPFCIVQGFYF